MSAKLIKQLIKRLIRESEATSMSSLAGELSQETENTFLDHIRGWVEIYVKHIFYSKEQIITDLDGDDTALKQIQTLINQDVEDNDWLEHDLGPALSKNPGHAITSALFSILKDHNMELIYRLDMFTLSSKVDRDEVDPAQVEILIDQTTDYLVDNLHILDSFIEGNKSRWSADIVMYHFDPMHNKQINRAVITALFEDAFRWSQRNLNDNDEATSTFKDWVTTRYNLIVQRNTLPHSLSSDIQTYLRRVHVPIDLNEEDDFGVVISVIKNALQTFNYIATGDLPDASWAQSLRPWLLEIFTGLDDPQTGTWKTRQEFNVEDVRVVDVPHSVQFIDAFAKAGK